MPRTGPTGAPQTRAQLIAYYAGYLAKLPGTYQGNETAYKGLTWAKLYTTLANANPKDDPKQLADAILGVEAAQRTGTGVQAAGNTLGKLIGSSEKAIAQTNFAAGVPNPLAGLLQIGAIFEAAYKQLTKVSMWRSVGWIVLGVAFIIAGIAWWAKSEATGVAKGMLFGG